MKANDALRKLAEVTSGQWGMVTTAQASTFGVTRLMLSRLAEARHIERLTHGVYKDAGAPDSEFDALRAAWLSVEPKRLAEDRVSDAAGGAVVASTSAAFLHGVGDAWAGRHEFVAPVRRQSQRKDIRFRQRDIEDRDITLLHGLPTMRIERMLADLLEDLGDQSLVADTLNAAMKKYVVDLDRLSELLSPLAERNGFKKDDGSALVNKLAGSVGLDLDSVARRITANPLLGARVTAEYMQSILSADQCESLRKAIAEIRMPHLDAIFKLLPSVESLGLTQSMLGTLNAQVFANMSQQWVKNGTFPSVLQGILQIDERTHSKEQHDSAE